MLAHFNVYVILDNRDIERDVSSEILLSYRLSRTIPGDISSKELIYPIQFDCVKRPRVTASQLRDREKYRV